jgi:hypothetical protein
MSVLEIDQVEMEWKVDLLMGRTSKHYSFQLLVTVPITCEWHQP